LGGVVRKQRGGWKCQRKKEKSGVQKLVGKEGGRHNESATIGKVEKKTAVLV